MPSKSNVLQIKRQALCCSQIHLNETELSLKVPCLHQNVCQQTTGTEKLQKIQWLLIIFYIPHADSLRDI